MEGPSPPSTEGSSLPEMHWWESVTIIAVGSLWAPLRLWTQNTTRVGRLERLFLVSMSVMAIALLAIELLRRLGASRRGTSYGVLIAVLVFFDGAVLLDRSPAAGWLLAGCLLATTCLVLARLRASRGRDLVMTSLVFYLALSPVASLLTNGSLHRGGPVRLVPDPLSATLVSKPDIFLVVLDGYASSIALRNEFGFDNAEVEAELRSLGYQVPGSAWANYSMTHASIPSLLLMDYPLAQGSAVTPRVEGQLYDVIRGANPIVEVLRSEGYEFTLVESGWGGSSCGEGVDHCVASPFLDDATFTILENSLLGPMVRRRFGSAFTVGALHAMGWLLDNGSRLATNEVPDLVVAHVLAPHSPTFLNEACSMRYDQEFEGRVLTRPGYSQPVVGARKSAYLRQVGCVNGFVRAFAASLPQGPVVVLSADHGSDSLGQVFTDPRSWTERQLRERMNIFLAVKFPAGCALPDPVLLVDVFRSLFGCLSGSDLERLPQRFFLLTTARGATGAVLPVREVDSPLVSRVIDQAGVSAGGFPHFRRRLTGPIHSPAAV